MYKRAYAFLFCFVEFAKPSMLSAVLPQRHPAEGMFEWLMPGDSCAFCVSEPFAVQVFGSLPFESSFCLDGYCTWQKSGKKNEEISCLFPEFCYASERRATKKRTGEAVFQLHWNPRVKIFAWQILKEILHTERTLNFQLYWIVFVFSW